MTTNTITSVMQMLDTMSVEELRIYVAPYLEERLNPRVVGVEVRMKDMISRQGRYAVLLILENGSEVEVKFRDRHSRLIYIYTLLHPKGFHRRNLTVNNYQPLRELFSKIYFESAEPLLKAIGNDFDHYISQAVAQSRWAIRQAVAYADDFEIAPPQQHGGKTLVSFAVQGGDVIIDNSLQ